MDINKVQFQCELEEPNTEEWTVQCLVVEKTPPIFVLGAGFQGGVFFLPLNLDILEAVYFGMF